MPGSGASRPRSRATSERPKAMSKARDLATRLLIAWPFMAFAVFVIFLVTVLCGVNGGHSYTGFVARREAIFTCRRCFFRKVRRVRRSMRRQP